MWMEERGGLINEERARQAAETGAGTLAVACPFCTVMLDDGVKARGDDMRVVDVSTLIAESLDDSRRAPLTAALSASAPSALERLAAPALGARDLVERVEVEAGDAGGGVGERRREPLEQRVGLELARHQARHPVAVVRRGSAPTRPSPIFIEIRTSLA